ncbi:DUF342 domain-containing protein [Mucisphaera calidilacus]|uniref:Flagellar Assembly Protein A N-terminal region domain-containing protein n=1 Tax=Mucisphaera calidilacus TaxID=2527982 RepID=A0A518C0J1_9BACT|nr:FapA family protein [Mucisphaera calidilacus]QDU72745.1 hypothetical protein Pan265_26190 [Mucisphaera calidilacus]
MPDTPKDRDISVKLAPDRMTAELKVPAGFDAEHLTTVYVEQAASEKNIHLTDEVRSAIDRAIRERKPGENLTATIAEGTPAEHGQDGYVQWLVKEPDEKTDNDQTENTDDAPHSLSHYDRSAFIMVKRGQKIGKIHEPTAGEDGREICGEVVKAHMGTAAKLDTNDSIEIKPAGDLIATCRGVLLREHSRAVIESQLEVNGYVDFSTGHIDFCGDVLITKGVRDLFRVKADGNIEIRGLIESATIICTGDLHAKGGFAGGEDGTVDVGNDLHARYLNDVSGQVHHNLIIDKELLGSDLVIHGNLEAPRASLVGGTIQLVGSGTVNELGSPGGMATNIVLGALPKLEPLAEQLRQIIRISEQQLEELTVENENLKYLKKPNAEQKERMTMIMCDFSMTETRLKKAQGALETLEERMEQDRVVDLTVTARAFPAVVFTYRGVAMKLKNELRGPVHFCRNPRNDLVVETDGIQTPIEKLASLANAREAA